MACDGYLLLCHAMTMSRYASSRDRKEVRNSLLPPLHSISIELGKPQCRLFRTFVTSCKVLPPRTMQLSRPKTWEVRTACTSSCV